MFSKQQDKLFCPKCGYSMIKPWPPKCPKCKMELDAVISDLNHDKQNREQQEFKALETHAQKVAADKNAALSPKEFKPSVASASTKVKGVRKKLKPANSAVNFDGPIIDITPGEEYIKLLGVVGTNRIALFCSNPRYEYFLELSCNLSDIATGILGGELDRMSLYSEELHKNEKCLFLEHEHVIYVIYGLFPDRKGSWVLNRMRNEMATLLNSAEKDIADMSKLELHSINSKFLNLALGIINEYVNLTKVFSNYPLPSIDQTVRVDYFGLSFQSIGVISKIFGDDLKVEGISADDPALRRELQESLITAKLEAIAANTIGNTRAIPKWIGVKLSFEAYRFIIFEPMPNGYFYQILVEGNLEAGIKLREMLRPLVAESIQESFKGDLRRFQPLSAALDQLFTQRVFGLANNAQED